MPVSAEQQCLRGMKSTIGAARLRMTDMRALHGAESAEYRLLSRTQSEAIIEMAKAKEFVNLTYHDKNEVVAAILQVPWASNDGEKISDAITNQVSRTKRRANQDFTACLDYFSAGEWAEFKTGHTSANQRIIDSRVQALGLVCPSEVTLKYLAVFWAMVSNSEEELLAVDEAGLVALMQTWRRLFTNLRKLVKTDFGIQTLPGDPIVLKQQHPELYSRCFPEGNEPVPFPLCSIRLRTLLNAFNCRGSAKSSPAVVSSLLTPSGHKGSLPMALLAKVLRQLGPGGQFATASPRIQYLDRRTRPRSLDALADEDEDSQPPRPWEQDRAKPLLALAATPARGRVASPSASSAEALAANPSGARDLALEAPPANPAPPTSDALVTTTESVARQVLLPR